MATAYLIAFYDTRRRTIDCLRFASEYPVSQMHLGRVQQLLVASVNAADYHRADQTLKTLLHGPAWDWVWEYLS